MGFGSLLEKSFPNTREEEEELVQSYLLFLFFPLSLFFTIVSNLVYAFYLIVLENELTFTVRGSFEETQTISVGRDSRSPLPDPTFFHYARYKQPSLDIALRKRTKLPTFVRYPRHGRQQRLFYDLTFTSE